MEKKLESQKKKYIYKLWKKVEATKFKSWNFIFFCWGWWWWENDADKLKKKDCTKMNQWGIRKPTLVTKPSGAKCMYIYIFVSVRQKSCSEWEKWRNGEEGEKSRWRRRRRTVVGREWGCCIEVKERSKSDEEERIENAWPIEYGYRWNVVKKVSEMREKVVNEKWQRGKSGIFNWGCE